MRYRKKRNEVQPRLEINFTPMVAKLPLLYVINSNEVLLRKENCDIIHKTGALHRAIHILVVNSKGDIFVRKRSTKKKLYPEVWSTSVGAHILEDDTPEITAETNLTKFLGLQLPLTPIGECRVKDDIENELMYVYVCHAQTIDELNPEESDEGKFMSLTTIREMIRKNETTPHLTASCDLLERYISS